MRDVIAVPRTILTVVTGVVATLIGALSVYVLARRDPRDPRIEQVAAWWAHAWLRAAGCRLEVEGAEHVDQAHSHVVVANHQSTFDIMSLFAGVPLPIRFLAKKELFSIPLLAPAMREMGIVEVDRGGRAAAIASVNRQSGLVIERGHSLIIFPEGTRSRDGEIHEFKKGAFMIAVTGQMPILPVTIHGSREAWEPHRAWIHGGRTIRMVIHPRVETEGKGRGDVTGLRDEVEATIRAEFEHLRASAVQS